MNRPVLRARGIGRRFANGRGIARIDLAARAGELIALVGASGAGKTTLLRLLAGLDASDAGDIELEGEPLARRRHGDTRIALIYQRPRLVGRLDVARNVLAGRLGHLARWRGLLGIYSDADWRLALAALTRVGLAAHASDRADRLSGGEQQRVSIARALAQEPLLLLADEPVASLDPDNARAVMLTLRACADAGLAVVTSLHQPALATEFADRVVTLG
ncbi:MAG: ATP-binding cassette domain-containing protein [Burkholderiaceae bacterium]